jgi:hypothetical protein
MLIQYAIKEFIPQNSHLSIAMGPEHGPKFSKLTIILP